MKPQTQRWNRGPVYSDSVNKIETDKGGDCFAACIASILEVPIEGFPNFLARVGDKTWWERWQDWLYDNYRCKMVFWDKDEDGLPDVTQLAWWIAEVQCGKISHSVIFHRNEFKFDPIPGRPLELKYTLEEVISVTVIYSIASLFEQS
jgi:hypothetical protein